MIKSNMILTHTQNDDILLNNFQIKKETYKVLFNYDHIVWERLDAKRSQIRNVSGNNEKKPPVSDAATTAAIQKETEYEKEQLSHKAAYGGLTNILHLHDVIRVSKGVTKAASVRNAHEFLNRSEEQLQTHEVTSTPTEQYLTFYYAERIIASPTDRNRWQIRHLTLHNSDPYVVAKWYESFKTRLHTNPNRRVKRLLVFINPYGGSKMALKIYNRHCKEILQLAGIDDLCIITQRSNQIQDVLMNHDLTPYDAVCCVGGDGTVAEMINGLVWRAIKDKGLDLRKPNYIPKPTLPVAIIPAGSTDSIVYSLNGTSDAKTAAIHLVLGQRRGLDICSVRNSEGIIRFCTSIMGYGYLGDVAAKSEKYRWMGTKRYEYTGVKTFLLNRAYEAEIRLLLNDEEVDGNGSTKTISLSSEDTICHAYCQRCSTATLKTSDNDDDNANDDNRPSSSNSSLCTKRNTLNFQIINEHSGNFDRNICDKNYLKPMEKQTQIKDLIDSKESAIYKTSSPSSSSSSINAQLEQDQQQQKLQQEQQQKQQQQQLNVKQECALSETSKEDSQKWRVICGEFFMINAVNISCACTRSPNGMSKYCHLGDGQLDVILVRKTNFFNRIRFVINTMRRQGNVRNLPFVEIYRTRQFMFKVKPNNWPQDCNSVRGSCQPINESFNGQVEHSNSNNLYSCWNCDGEVVNDLEVTMTSHRQLVDVFMRGPYIYN